MQEQESVKNVIDFPGQSQDNMVKQRDSKIRKTKAGYELYQVKKRHSLVQYDNAEPQSSNQNSFKVKNNPGNNHKRTQSGTTRKQMSTMKNKRNQKNHQHKFVDQHMNASSKRSTPIFKASSGADWNTGVVLNCDKRVNNKNNDVKYKASKNTSKPQKQHQQKLSEDEMKKKLKGLSLLECPCTLTLEGEYIRSDCQDCNDFSGKVELMSEHKSDERESISLKQSSKQNWENKEAARKQEESNEELEGEFQVTNSVKNMFIQNAKNHHQGNKQVYLSSEAHNTKKLTDELFDKPLQNQLLEVIDYSQLKTESSPNIANENMFSIPDKSLKKCAGSITSDFRDNIKSNDLENKVKETKVTNSNPTLDYNSAITNATCTAVEKNVSLDDHMNYGTIAKNSGLDKEFGDVIDNPKINRNKGCRFVKKENSVPLSCTEEDKLDEQYLIASPTHGEKDGMPVLDLDRASDVNLISRLSCDENLDLQDQTNVLQTDKKNSKDVKQKSEKELVEDIQCINEQQNLFSSITKEINGLFKISQYSEDQKARSKSPSIFEVLNKTGSEALQKPLPQNENLDCVETVSPELNTMLPFNLSNSLTSSEDVCRLEEKGIKIEKEDRDNDSVKLHQTCSPVTIDSNGKQYLHENIDNGSNILPKTPENLQCRLRKSRQHSFIVSILNENKNNDKINRVPHRFSQTDKTESHSQGDRQKSLKKGTKSKTDLGDKNRKLIRDQNREKKMELNRYDSANNNEVEQMGNLKLLCNTNKSNKDHQTSDDFPPKQGIEDREYSISFVSVTHTSEVIAYVVANKKLLN